MTWYTNKRATTVFPDGDGYEALVYHQTKVCRWNSKEIVLNSGGYLTATTKLRLNQCANEYNLGFTVFQSKRQWFVTLPNGDTVPFYDGIRIAR